MTPLMLETKINETIEADKVFTMLMGDEVEPRRHFIETNGLSKGPNPLSSVLSVSAPTSDPSRLWASPLAQNSSGSYRASQQTPGFRIFPSVRRQAVAYPVMLSI